jgi:hypothetical protein
MRPWESMRRKPAEQSGWWLVGRVYATSTARLREENQEPVIGTYANQGDPCA